MQIAEGKSAQDCVRIWKRMHGMQAPVFVFSPVEERLRGSSMANFSTQKEIICSKLDRVRLLKLTHGMKALSDAFEI